MSNGRILNYEETRELAKILGFVLLEPKENFKTFNDYMSYQCLKCGNKENTRLRTIEKRKIKCKECCSTDCVIEDLIDYDWEETPICDGNIIYCKECGNEQRI